MMGKRGPKPVKYPLPDIDLKYIVVPFDDNFIFYQNGDMFSRKSGKFLKRSKNKYGGVYYTLLNKETNQQTSFSIKKNLMKYFNNVLPEFQGIEHKPIEGYEDLYQIYSDGKIWSKRNYMFLVSIKRSSSEFVCLSNKNKQLHTFYINKQLSKYFKEG